MKNKKGFTLIELNLSLLLYGVLIVMATLMLTTTVKITFSSQQTISETEQLYDTFNYIYTTAKSADEVIVSDDGNNLSIKSNDRTSTVTLDTPYLLLDGRKICKISPSSSITKENNKFIILFYTKEKIPIQLSFYLDGSDNII